ncbi:MAG: peptidoglycan bridge formation glycyltransferase FemA/FemB family protein [Treponema sp.]|nr:peptidoglycan bridge formation glycyltransferase FemA/FemB family protein [Treponema sp.]MCL2251564.1 peptidoglycan bridge formation glycyltransferase FemA/FemB family protein [Treponema sp.]
MKNKKTTQNLNTSDSFYIKKITKADLEICKEASSFLQSAMWGEFKSLFGWNAKAFLIEWSYNEIQERTNLLILYRRLVPGFSFAYVPWGPQLPSCFTDNIKPNVTAELADKLKSFFAHNTVFIRFEPPWFIAQNDEFKNSIFADAGFKKSAATVQPPDTVIIDLSASCEELLAKMKPKWRYNISLAGKKSVQVNIGTENDLEIFYSLLKETAVRDGIAVHNINYYRTLYDLCKKKEGVSISLYTAKHEDDVLAAIIVLFYGKEATYLYGASSKNKRNLMAPYALQWRAMQDAKEAGCLYYDLFGIPPNEDPNHPMAGLYRFKTGFGGQIIHRPGSWDYAYKPFFYALFNIAEAFRKKLMNLKKKRR